MPFRPYKAFFKPDELDSLNDAYDAAWQHVRRSTSGAMTPSRATDLKNRIAKMILASACTGERNTDRLTEIALRGVSGRGTARRKEPA
jgi:cytochrome P450